MYTIKIKTPDGLEQYLGPSNYEELTVRGFQTMMKNLKNPSDRVEVFCALYGCQYDDVANSDSDKLMYIVNKTTQFIYDTDVHTLPVPKRLSFNGEWIPFPKKRTIGQAIHIKQALEDAKTHDELISIVCAVYMQPYIDDKPFDLDRAQEIEQQILDESILRYAGLGFFLLRRLTTPGMNFPAAWRLMMQMNWKQRWMLLPELMKSSSFRI